MQIKTRKKLTRAAAYLLAFLAFYLGSIFLFGWATDWEPAEKTVLLPRQSASKKVIEDSVLTAGIWNVGYGGLGAESEFFYDNGGFFSASGQMVRSGKWMVDKNNRGIEHFLRTTPSDFWLLQEVDSASKRSFFEPQLDQMMAELPAFSAFYAENFRTELVPIPLFEPWHFYGKARSGLASFSKFEPTEAVRWQLPGRYAMPDRLFQLDRCAAMQRFSTRWGPDLVVFNVHNSAYDPGDRIKKLQLPYLKQLALTEFEKGNWVILGGDWNQCPPFFSPGAFGQPSRAVQKGSSIEADFFPDGWHFIYDPTMPTNRKCDRPYERGKTFVELIDFFVVSPNVRATTVKAHDLDFRFSDHQPVLMEFQLIR